MITFPPNTSVLISNNMSDPKRWWCQLTVKNDSAKVECQGHGTSLEEAVSEACLAFAPFFAALPATERVPVLEHVSSDDEIPF